VFLLKKALLHIGLCQIHGGLGCKVGKNRNSWEKSVGGRQTNPQ